MESEISIEEVTMRVTEHGNDKFSLCIFNVSLFRNLNSARVFYVAGKKQRVWEWKLFRNLNSACVFHVAGKKTKSLRMEIASSIK